MYDWPLSAALKEHLRNASTALITGNYRNFHDFPRYEGFATAKNWSDVHPGDHFDSRVNDTRLHWPFSPLARSFDDPFAGKGKKKKKKEKKKDSVPPDAM